jgi:hypothetical protein
MSIRRHGTTIVVQTQGATPKDHSSKNQTFKTQAIRIFGNQIQRTSEYQASLVFKWSKSVLLSNGLVLRHHLKSELKSLDFE